MSGVLFLDSVLTRVIASVKLRASLNQEDELAATQALTWPNLKSLGEVRTLGQPKSLEMSMAHFLCNDLIVRLAKAK